MISIGKLEKHECFWTRPLVRRSPSVIRTRPSRQMMLLIKRQKSRGMRQRSLAVTIWNIGHFSHHSLRNLSLFLYFYIFFFTIVWSQRSNLNQISELIWQFLFRRLTGWTWRQTRETRERDRDRETETHETETDYTDETDWDCERDRQTELYMIILPCWGSKTSIIISKHTQKKVQKNAIY